MSAIESIEPSSVTRWERGTRLGECRVQAVIHRGAGSVILQARSADDRIVVLKAVPTADTGFLRHEARCLRALSGCPTPEALAPVPAGDGDAYLTMSWLPGADGRSAAAELRGEPDGRAALGRMCQRLADAYACIHERGVVHGAVYPSHTVVERDGEPRLLDFTSAWITRGIGDGERRERQLGPLSSPEQAVAWMSGGPSAVPDERGEQYSLAALMYLLVTGRVHVGPIRDRRTLAERIAAGATLTFSAAGAEPWPELETVLMCALSADPRARFASVRELGGAIGRVVANLTRPPARGRATVTPPLARILDQFRASTAIDGPLLSRGVEPGPTCSVNHGSAGIAFALYRLARADDDARTMSAAQAWLSRAWAGSGSPDAFSDHAEITPETVGRVSPFHSISGLALVEALISRSRRDGPAEQEAIARYLASSEGHSASLDLTLGRCSVLLGAALLLDGADRSSPSTRELIAHGDRELARIWAELPGAPCPYLGIAHGQAGLLYATLLWSRTRGIDAPASARDRLERLADLAEPHRRGLRWPRTETATAEAGAYMPGWCNGPAGHVFLWTLAAEFYREPALLAYAEGAAWATWESNCNITSLCCGVAGEAYALLNMHRATGQGAWLARAAARANEAAQLRALAPDATTGEWSLYKGHAGLALLAAELADADRAAMPLFEPEPR